MLEATAFQHVHASRQYHVIKVSEDPLATLWLAPSSAPDLALFIEDVFLPEGLIVHEYGVIATPRVEKHVNVLVAFVVVAVVALSITICLDPAVPYSNRSGRRNVNLECNSISVLSLNANVPSIHIMSKSGKVLHRAMTRSMTRSISTSE